MWVKSMSTEGERGPQPKEHSLCTCSSSWKMSGKLSASWTFRTLTLGQTLQEKPSSLFGPLLSLYLVRHWCHSCKFCRPSPSVFAYYNQSKTGRWEALRTRLGSCATTLIVSVNFYVNEGSIKWTVHCGLVVKAFVCSGKVPHSDQVVLMLKL